MGIHKEVDILIVGGGLIGALLLLALADTDLRVVLVDMHSLSSRTENDFDARSLALSPASIRILQMLQVWPLLKPYAQPIETIHISEKHCFGHARLHSVEDAPLGYVVEIQQLSRSLGQLLNRNDMMTKASLIGFDKTSRCAKIKTEIGELTIKARLVVAADGADSAVRQFCGLQADVKEYKEMALVANIGLARTHHACAYERFTANGSLALLPMIGHRSALVWSFPKEQALYWEKASEDRFLEKLQATFGYRLGRFVKVGRRVTYPLRQVSMSTLYSDGVVFIGNAAHTLHPVAGQGFNLGLRDVAQLSQNIIQDGLAQDMLQAYQQARHFDQVSMTYFTHYLVRLFKNTEPVASFMRGIGLITLDNSAFLKNRLAHFARGFGGVIPDLVCGIPLSSKEP